LQRRAETESRSTAPELPSGVRVLRDVAYGSDAKQKLDVYRSDRPLERAPIVLMVHGGAWRMGDKAASPVVENKVSRWAPRGIVLVSIDYRLLPTPVEDQLADVLQALVFVQRHAAEWGGDAGKIVLMGHSAGAHLIDLLDASPAKARQAGALPWLGAVSLDSAVLDVPALMRERHLALYDEALGNDPARWRALSPLDQLVAGAPPLLAVCSSKRRDRPCDPAAFRRACGCVGQPRRSVAASAFARTDQRTPGHAGRLHDGGRDLHGVTGSDVGACFSLAAPALVRPVRR
jgi:acetyl esterase/lipase